MFNRAQFGLHHLGNIVPTCTSCNRRRKDTNNEYLNWEDHLKEICEESNNLKVFEYRKNKILRHINEGEFKYPKLSKTENNAIKVISNSHTKI